MDWAELEQEISLVLEGAKPSQLYYTTVPQLFHCNLARGRGFFAKSVLAQVTSTTEPGQKLAMLASIVAVVNSKIPLIGKLVLFQCTKMFLEFYTLGCNLRDGRANLCEFVVHLANQHVCGEILPLEILLKLLERVKLLGVGAGELLFQFVVGLVYRFGNHMSSRPGLAPALDSLFQGLAENAIGQSQREVLVGELERVRQTRFALFPSIPLLELDLLRPQARVVHELFLEDDPGLEVTDYDFYTVQPANTTREQVLKQEEVWLMYQRECLRGMLPDRLEEKEDRYAGREEGEVEVQLAVKHKPTLVATVAVEDRTSRDVLEIRKRIYLTINHGLSFEQVAHELILQRKPGKFLCGHDVEIVQMLVEFCSQLKSYTDFIGLLCCRLCVALPDRPLVPLFEQEFARQYAGMHLLETTKMRNLAMLLAEMLYKQCLNWPKVFAAVELGETTTTSSSRIFLKFLFQRLAQLMSMDGLRQRLLPLSDFPGLFPKGKRAKQVRFAVNFFTSIGLGSFTVEMRDWLKTGQAEEEDDDSSSSSSSSSSSESDSSARRRRKKKRSKKSKRAKRS
ncbi:hypothetical protein BASA81_008463 [Batrachochytrium salamandrivorans]|nr:hypothetical protein BASA81_008463 [Batrachochytrium salamandrivorans]